VFATPGRGVGRGDADELRGPVELRALIAAGTNVAELLALAARDRNSGVMGCFVGDFVDGDVLRGCIVEIELSVGAALACALTVVARADVDAEAVTLADAGDGSLTEAAEAVKGGSVSAELVLVTRQAAIPPSRVFPSVSMVATVTGKVGAVGVSPVSADASNLSVGES